MPNPFHYESRHGLTSDRAQGNILITLDDQPATFALLERIRAVIQKDLKISKDIQLFGQIHHEHVNSDADSPLPLIKIIAGDPGKGSIALSGGYRVSQGDAVQLFYEDVKALEGRRKTSQASKSAIAFTTIEADANDSYDGAAAKTVQLEEAAKKSVMKGIFMGCSSAGSIVGRPSRTWVQESTSSVAVLD